MKKIKWFFFLDKTISTIEKIHKLLLILLVVCAMGAVYTFTLLINDIKKQNKERVEFIPTTNEVRWRTCISQFGDLAAPIDYNILTYNELGVLHEIFMCYRSDEGLAWVVFDPPECAIISNGRSCSKLTGASGEFEERK